MYTTSDFLSATNKYNSEINISKTSIDETKELESKNIYKDRIKTLDRINVLSSLNELERMRKLSGIDELERMRKLSGIDELERMRKLSGIDELERMRKLSGIDELERMRKLSGIDELERMRKLSGIDELERVSKIPDHFGISSKIARAFLGQPTEHSTRKLDSLEENEEDNN